jgi:hypothetical protein
VCTLGVPAWYIVKLTLSSPVECGRAVLQTLVTVEHKHRGSYESKESHENRVDMLAETLAKRQQ